MWLNRANLWTNIISCPTFREKLSQVERYHITDTDSPDESCYNIKFITHKEIITISVQNSEQLREKKILNPLSNNHKILFEYSY